MADVTFNTKQGEAIQRKLLLLFLNTGTSTAPEWNVVGKRVEDSSMEFDWGEESNTDILGNTYTTMKDPVITQSFDPCQLDSGDAAQIKVWNQSVRDHDTGAMTNNDVLVVHSYTGSAAEGAFAERYPASTVKPTGLGGSSHVGMPIEVTFGGERQKGTAKKDAGGKLTFTPEQN